MLEHHFDWDSPLLKTVRTLNFSQPTNWNDKSMSQVLRAALELRSFTLIHPRDRIQITFNPFTSSHKLLHTSLTDLSVSVPALEDIVRIADLPSLTHLRLINALIQPSSGCISSLVQTSPRLKKLTLGIGYNTRDDIPRLPLLLPAFWPVKTIKTIEFFMVNFDYQVESLGQLCPPSVDEIRFMRCSGLSSCLLRRMIEGREKRFRKLEVDEIGSFEVDDGYDGKFREWLRANVDEVEIGLSLEDDIAAKRRIRL